MNAIEALHDRQHSNELKSRRGQVQNVINRLRTIKAIATGSRSVPCSPCLVDPRYSDVGSGKSRLKNNHVRLMLNDRRRPLSLGNIGLSKAPSYCNLKRRNEKASNDEQPCHADMACSDQSLQIHQHALDTSSPTPTLTVAQRPVPTEDHQTSSGPNDANLRSDESSNARTKRCPTVLVAGTGMNLRVLRKRRHRTALIPART